MENVHYYQVRIDWKKDRKGIASSNALPETIEVATPPEFPKGMAGIWSPEHLLLAAVNSCLMTTFLAIAENSKFDFINFESNATGKLEKVDDKYLISEITLNPVISIKFESEKEKALRLIEKSEAACLISNSIKSKIILNPQVKVLFLEYGEVSESVGQ
jgi:peroxiredoxin-like protein